MAFLVAASDFFLSAAVVDVTLSASVVSVAAVDLTLAASVF